MVSDAFHRADAIVSRLFAAGPSKKEIPIDGDRSCLAAGPFCAKTIPGKGVGLCATRDIGIGDAAHFTLGGDKLQHVRMPYVEDQHKGATTRTALFNEPRHKAVQSTP